MPSAPLSDKGTIEIPPDENPIILIITLVLEDLSNAKLALVLGSM